MAYNIFRASSPQMPQMQNILGPGYDPGYEAPAQRGYTMPPEPDEYMREEMGDEMFRMYQNMNQKQRLDFLNDPANGFVPPTSKKPVGTMQSVPMSRFNDAAAYRTADAGAIFSTAAQPNVSDDTVLSRSVREEELKLRNSLNGLQGILDELQRNPTMLEDAHTITGRMATGALQFRDRLGIDALDISPEDEMRLGNKTQYLQRILTNVNQYIKDITGAQVGQGDETRRLMAVQPNEDDSPTQLVAKITGAIDMARLEIVRRRVMNMTGGEQAPTDQQLRQILVQRGQEYLQQAQQEGLSGNDARMWAAQKMSEEFGF